MGQKKTGPNCYDCRHFNVSWDKQRPYGCDYLGFKGKKIPSMEVFQATGKHCVWFQHKNGNQPSAEAEFEEILPPGCSVSITA